MTGAILFMSILGAALGFGPKPGPEQRFWDWFTRNTGHLAQIKTGQEPIAGELAERLKRIHPRLTWETGTMADGRHEMIISADGLTEAIPAVKKLVAAAPGLKGWKITAFRPRTPLGGPVRFGAVEIGPDDVWISAARDGNRIGLTLYVRGLKDSGDHDMLGAIFILLDHALGEYDVMTRVGFIERRPLPSSPASQRLRPFSELRRTIDSFKH